MITLDAWKDNGFVVRWPYFPDNAKRYAIINKVKQTAGFIFNPQAKGWIADGPEVLLDMDRVKLWPFVTTITPAARARVDKFRIDLEGILTAKHSKDDPFTWGEYAYQQAGTEALVRQVRGLLADDMGLGKSKQALDGIDYIWQNNLAKQQTPLCLVVAPNSLVYNWAAEIDKWYPEWNMFVVPNGKADRAKMWRVLDDYYDIPVVVIVNYEKLRLADWPKDIKWDVIVCDEAQKIKNTQTATHKAVKKLKTQFLWGLTGTPLEMRVEEVYGIMSILRPAVFGNFLRFREQHLVTDSWGQVIGQRNPELLKERLGPWMTRRKKADVLKQLPPKIYNTVYAEMSPDEAKEYMRIKHEFLAWLKDKDTMSNEATSLTQLLRLQQFTCSPVLLEGTMPGCKYEMLRETIDGWEGQVMVFTRFAKMANLLLEWMECNPSALIAGEVKSEDRVKRVAAFNEGKLGKVLVSTDAGAYGLNVTSADLVIHYDQLWNPGKMRQREDRLHRIGQENIVNVVNLVVTGTIDEGMMKVLAKRQALFDDIIEGAEDAAITKIGTAGLKKIVEGNL